MAKKLKFQTYDFDVSSQNPVQVNVRQDSVDGSLRPVGSPAPAGNAPGALLGSVGCKGRHVVVSTLDGDVYVNDPLKDAAVKAGTLDCDITSAVNVEGGMLLMSALSGEPPCRLTVDFETGEAAIEKPLPRHGAPRLVRIDDGVLSVPLPARKLKGSYSRTDRSLLPDDLHTLTDDYAMAYRDICGLAASRHRFIQPVMARVTARDSRGTMVYRSAPVLITPQSGAQLTETSRSLGGDALNEAGAATVQAVPFSIGIVFPAAVPSLWRERVAIIEVETSEQIHPVTFSLPSAARIESAGSQSAALVVTAPGVDAASGGIAADGSEMRRRITGVLMNTDSALSVAHSMPLPAGASTVTGIYRASSPDCSRQVDSVIATASLLPADKASSTDSRLLDYPHTFSAACAGSAGGKILWGNITAKMFGGYTVAEQSVGTDSSTAAVAATSIITLDDGRMLVDSITERVSVTKELSPLIVYPHPSAVKITILTGTKMWEASMRPTPCRRMAYALASDLRPVIPSVNAGMHVVPDAATVTEHYPATVAIADTAAPLEIEAAATAAPGAITAITAELRAGSSLDITRRRFYVFSRGGISSVTSGGSPLRLTPVMLDHRAVMMPQSVCAAADGILAVAGGDLVKISGNKATTLLVNAGPCSLGLCGRYGEVWLVSASVDPTLIFNPATGYAYYRTDVYPEEMISAGDRLLLRMADGALLDASAEQSGSMDVEMTFRICLKRAKAVRAFGVRAYGGTVKGKIILAADNGIHSPDGVYRIVDFDIDGELNRPLESRVAAHPFRYITLGVRASVSHDFRLEGAWCATLA
ncbi:MAG: hypothetical protein K2L14_06005 [Duncaniella sp.]|nr:hypothetical protein [Duncaniella sp.]